MRDKRESDKAAELAEQAKAANRGVLNGPLMTGGHRAKGEGGRESLRFAIEDLIATYGDRYPRGKEFLQRLQAIQDERLAEFLTLKQEALLANPLLDFDQPVCFQCQAEPCGCRRCFRFSPTPLSPFASDPVNDDS